MCCLFREVFVELGLDIVDQLLDAGGFHFGAHFGNGDIGIQGSGSKVSAVVGIDRGDDRDEVLFAGGVVDKALGMAADGVILVALEDFFPLAGVGEEVPADRFHGGVDDGPHCVEADVVAVVPFFELYYAPGMTKIVLYGGIP